MSRNNQGSLQYSVCRPNWLHIPSSYIIRVTHFMEFGAFFWLFLVKTYKLQRDWGNGQILGNDQHRPRPNTTTGASRGYSAYWMRQRCRVSWKIIAIRLKYRSIEGARGAAKRYAARETLKWPVLILSRGAMFYAAYHSGESWIDIGVDFGCTPSSAQNAARGWSRTHKKRWPPRKMKPWETSSYRRYKHKYKR